MSEVVNVKACPLCGSETSQDFDHRMFRNYAVQNRLCCDCGFIYQSPRMSDTALAVFYEAEYRLAYQNEAGPTHKDLFVQQKRAVELTRFLQANLPEAIKPPRHLDIGSSSGLLLEKLIQALGLQSVGVEPGDAYRDYARQRGLEVFDQLEKIKINEAGRFGLVSLIHVLEHLPEPVDYLKRLGEDYLAENGYLLVEVPNLYAHDSFEVAHLSAFSVHTLQQMLSKAGYTVLSLRIHGAPRSKVLSLYLTALAQFSKSAYTGFEVVPEKQVQLKRRLGLLRRRLLERLLPEQAWLPMPES